VQESNGGQIINYFAVKWPSARHDRELDL
jgi:hypothetical protein